MKGAFFDNSFRSIYSNSFSYISSIHLLKRNIFLFAFRPTRYEHILSKFTYCIFHHIVNTIKTPK